MACLLLRERYDWGRRILKNFYTDNEALDMERFTNIGIIKNTPDFNNEKIEHFETSIAAMRKRGSWTRGRDRRAF